jgi:hypothetical protein
MSQSAEIKDLASALAAAQAELTGALKDSKNPFFKSSYADLESVWSAIRAPLTKNKLCVIQTTDVRDGQTGIVTTLAHASGQWIQGFYPLSPIKNDPQAIGSAMTYARRYALAAIVGVYQTDDDGEAAQGRPAAQTAAPAKTNPAPGIKPQRPGPNDGNTQASLTLIQFGSMGGHHTFEYTRDELEGYLEKNEIAYAQGKKKKPDWFDQTAAQIRECIQLGAYKQPEGGMFHDQ